MTEPAATRSGLAEVRALLALAGVMSDELEQGSMAFALPMVEGLAREKGTEHFAWAARAVANSRAQLLAMCGVLLDLAEEAERALDPADALGPRLAEVTQGVRDRIQAHLRDYAQEPSAAEQASVDEGNG